MWERDNYFPIKNGWHEISGTPQLAIQWMGMIFSIWLFNIHVSHPIAVSQQFVKAGLQSTLKIEGSDVRDCFVENALMDHGVFLSFVKHSVHAW